jgi:translation initiation factor 3 subunit D
MVDLVMPEVNNFVGGWGPPPGSTLETPLGLYDHLEHLDKFPVTRIGRICDFTASGQRFQAEKGKGKGAKGFAKGKGPIQALAPGQGKDDEGFSLVDNRPIPGRPSGRGRGGGAKAKGRGKAIAVNYQEGILGQRQKPFFQATQNQPKGKGRKTAQGGAPRRGWPSFKEWSVQTRPEWQLMREILFTSLAKLQIDSKAVAFEDVMWCGCMPTYNKAFDRLTVKAERPMKRFEDLNFFNVTASDDPMLPDMLQSDPSVTVIATDHVLACLVAAARSVYSWDIVVSKVSNKLIFDKRDGSQIDFLTVNETAPDAPNADDKENVNGPLKLGQEASCINQNFSQMVLDQEVPMKELDCANPFEDEEGGSVASGAYRYRKITLPGNPKASSEFEQQPVSLIVRTEINCKMPGTDSSYVSVKALNEFEPKPNYNWRLHLESQRGACLATELKNNAFKLGRWTAEAILSGSDTMKIGYVSRQHPRDPWSHSILGCQTYVTDGFADQIGLTRNNMFGIIRNIIDLVMSWDDGKYLILKDPTKSVLRIHEIPWDTFAEDDEDEEEEEEEQELDEDGNAVPVAQPPTVGRVG